MDQFNVHYHYQDPVDPHYSWIPCLEIGLLAKIYLSPQIKPPSQYLQHFPQLLEDMGSVENLSHLTGMFPPEAEQCSHMQVSFLWST